MQLYETSDNSCQSFIMAVVDETWYKELEGRHLRVEGVWVLELLVPRLVHHRHDEGVTGIVIRLVQLPVVPLRFVLAFGAIDF